MTARLDAVGRGCRLGCAALLLWFTCVAAARADAGSPLSGSLRLDYFSSSRDLDQAHDLLGASLALEARHDLTERRRFEFEARLSRAPASEGGDDQSQLISAFWLLRQDAFDLRVGQQKLRWGKADGVNPTDFFTPLDYTVLLPLEADRYGSAAALRADIAVSETSSLSLIISPDFTASRLPWRSDSAITIQDRKPTGVRQPQYGARWSSTHGKLDWSLSAFNGFTTLPVLSLVADAGARRHYERYYPAIHGFGADMAASFGSWGVRAELAYTSLASDARQSVASNYFLVAGADRSLGDWNINVQALARYTADFRDTTQYSGAAQGFAATLNSIVYNQQEKFMYGATARIAASGLHDTLQAELLAIGWLQPGNYALRPLLTYALSDARKLRVGAEYYHGPGSSYFGLLERNRTVFVEVQQYF